MSNRSSLSALVIVLSLVWLVLCLTAMAVSRRGGFTVPTAPGIPLFIATISLLAVLAIAIGCFGSGQISRPAFVVCALLHAAALVVAYVWFAEILYVARL